MVRYRVTTEEWNAPDDHERVGEDEYVGPEADSQFDQLDEMGWIEVLEWEYEREAEEIHAPPELIKSDGGRLEAVVPTANGMGITSIGLGEWTCQRCGTDVNAGIVHDGDREIPEPGECPGCERKGPFKHRVEERTSSQEWRSIATPSPVWQPPTDVDPDADFGTVFDEVRDYIYTHWDAPDSSPEGLYDGLAAYAMSSWLRDDLDFAPHLLVHGSHETGKTRLLNTLTNVSYRAVNTASASPAAIYRGIDGMNLTMYISEYHDLADETQTEVDAVLKAGQKRGETIMRAEEQQGGGYGVGRFDPFSHVCIATQFEPRDDIVSRCFGIRTKPSSRDVPLTMESAEGIRNKLLALRLRTVGSAEMEEAKRQAEITLSRMGVEGRTAEKVLGLLAIGELSDRDLTEFVEWAGQADIDDDEDTEEAVFLQAAIDEAFVKIAEMGKHGESPADDWSDLELKLSDICERFNRSADRDVSPRYITEIRKRMGIGKTRHRDGTYVTEDGLKKELEDYAENYGIDWSPSEGVVADVDTGFMDGEPSAFRDSDAVPDGNEADGDETVSEVEAEIIERMGTICTRGDTSIPREKLRERLLEDGYAESKIEHAVDNLLTNGILYDTGDGIRTV